MDAIVYPETGACLNKYFLRSIKLVTNKFYGTEESREHETGDAFVKLHALANATKSPN
jgi:hypothetical protein